MGCYGSGDMGSSYHWTHIGLERRLPSCLSKTGFNISPSLLVKVLGIRKAQRSALMTSSRSVGELCSGAAGAFAAASLWLEGECSLRFRFYGRARGPSCYLVLDLLFNELLESLLARLLQQPALHAAIVGVELHAIGGYLHRA